MIPTLLFIKHISFTARTVENDLQILKDDFSVTQKNVNTGKGLSFFIALIKQFFYLLFNVYRFRIIYIWFADYHSFLPVLFAKLFRKVSVINIGGYDADEILIGTPRSLKGKFRKFCVKYSVKNCTKLIPVSNVIKAYLLRTVDESRCEVIYNCVNVDAFHPAENPEKENLIITVGGGGDFIKEAKRKRLDLFIELGNEFNERFPEYDAKFYLIGHDPSSAAYGYLKPLIRTKNVCLQPMTKSIDEITVYYRRASVYMQLSYYESFGIAQIEAMLSGCIPVSNFGGAIPEVVGDAGFIIKDFDKEKYLSVIKEILDKKHEALRIRAVQRVMENFTFEKRKTRLLFLLHSLL